MVNVLFIHGILGKPDYFDFLRPHIPAEGFHTEDILLEGHCDTPKAFGRASMARWRSQAKSGHYYYQESDCNRIVGDFSRFFEANFVTKY